jgi:pilus assembly protein CpaB
VGVVVAARDIPAGAPLRAGQLAVRRMPARYAPPLAYAAPREVAGQPAAVAIPRGTAVVPALLGGGEAAAPGPDLRPGERIADLVAVGEPELVQPGGRVDVLVTRERSDGAGSTRLALEDAEVLASAPAGGGEDGPARSSAPHVRVSLRVSVRQAVALAAAENFAREVRVLPRAAGDTRRGLQGLEAASG